MRRFEVKKLVKDEVLKKIEEQGTEVRYRVLEGEELIKAAINKLKEETNEVMETPIEKKENLLRELDDVGEVVKLMKQILNNGEETTVFKGRFFLEEVCLRDDDQWVDYYEKKYKEIK